MFSAERIFVTDCADALSRVEVLWRHADSEAADLNRLRETKALLIDIREGALPLQARAIYHSAGLTMDALNNPDRFSSNFHVLSRLIGQYTDGLNEIDPDYRADVQDGYEHVNAAAPVQNAAVPAQNAPAPAKDESLKAAQTRAANVLSSLIHFAPNPDHRKALSRLAGVEPAPDLDAAPALEVEIRPQSKIEPKTEPKDTAAPVETAESWVSFEDIMRPLTHTILACARQTGKQVSVSYAGEATRISAAQADVLQRTLTDIGLMSVRHSVETPDMRRSAGRSANAQIGFTARETAKDFVVQFEMEAGAAPILDFLPKERMARSGVKLSGADNAALQVEIALRAERGRKAPETQEAASQPTSQPDWLHMADMEISL